MQFSFDVQRALRMSWVVEAGYRAAPLGVHLPFNYNINQPAMDLYTPAQRSAIAAAIGTPRKERAPSWTLAAVPGVELDFALRERSHFHLP